MQRFTLSPHWRIQRTEDGLHIYGGADAEYLLDSPKKSFFDSLTTSTKPFLKTKLNTDDEALFEQLLSAAVLVPYMRPKKTTKLFIFGDAAAVNIPAKSFKACSASIAELGLLVKHTSSFANLLHNVKYQNVRYPHLFVDMSLHHTLSIGPLVFPGYTACVACLQGRIGNRWGDAEPATQPLAGARLNALADALIGAELEKIVQDQDYSLVNHSYEWDIAARNVQKNKLLKVPFCPVCNKATVDFSKPLVIPWT